MRTSKIKKITQLNQTVNGYKFSTKFITMTQILDSLLDDCVDKILCCYMNDTHQIKIARITNIPNGYFECVVFPEEKLLFEALPAAQLEIYTPRSSMIDLVEVYKCDRLAVKIAQVQQGCITHASKKIYSLIYCYRILNKL